MGLFSAINKAIDGIDINDYLQFQGISLGEPIDAFQAKLLSIGWKYEGQEGLGGKSFSGKFAGQSATLAVSYNAITKKVSFVMVIFGRKDKRLVAGEVEEHKNMLCEKYKIKPNFVKDGPQEEGAYYFELRHGRLICSMAQYIGDMYAAYIEYVNMPNNVYYVKKPTSDY